jgi:exodeoxyribonuclease V alpha subunit
MEWQGAFLDLRVGDRLMVVRNDYKLNVYNGDVGKLIRIGKNKSLVVRIHGVGGGDDDREVEFPEHDVEDKLQLAYAITCHKAQGQEFDTIILPVVKSQGWMLQRNLLYTAITRARKKVWLIGEEGAIEKAVTNNKVIHRNTVLAQVLEQLLSQPTV